MNHLSPLLLVKSSSTIPTPSFFSSSPLISISRPTLIFHDAFFRFKLIADSLQLTMASLTDQFTVATLPRIADVAFENRALVASPTLSFEDSLHVGISRASVSTYNLKPSPRLVWSYALAPSMIVDCIDVVDSDSERRFAVGVTDRKANKVLFIKKLDDGVEVFTIPVGGKVVSIKFSTDKDHVYIILEDSEVQVYNFVTVSNPDDVEDEELDQYTKPTHTLLNKLRHTTIIHHDYLSRSSALGSHTKDGFLLLVESVNKRLQARLLSLDLTNSIEIKSFQLQEHFNNSKFAYDPTSGLLHQYVLSTNSLVTYLLPHFTVDLLFELILPKSSNVGTNDVSILCAAPLRVIVSSGSSLYLYHTKFRALLDTYHEGENSETVLQSVVFVNGNTLRTTNTFAVYLNHLKKLNETHLNVIGVNVGFGTMSECLGKGIPVCSSKESSRSSFKALVNLLDDDFVQKELEAEKELQQVYKALDVAASNKDLQAWERILVPFLKGESWSSISKRKVPSAPSTPKKNKGKKSYEYRAFEVEKDRVVEYNFIKEILLLIFQTSDHNRIVLKQDFLPEHTLTYLLTHPLFPKIFTVGILELFEELNNLRLLRQALITCPNLGCNEIVGQLSTSNDDIFIDTVGRLIEEFSISQITDALLLKVRQRTDFNLQDIIKKCFILDCGWDLASAVVDAGGIFGWSSVIIDRLIEDVEQQLESLKRNNYNLTLTSQALLQVNDHKSQKSVKKKEAEEGDIVESTKQEDQLKSMLTIKNTSRRNILDDSLSKKVPSYSIEKLVL